MGKIPQSTSATPQLSSRKNSATTSPLDFLNEMQLEGITAILYHCDPSWVVKPRQVTDDMFFFFLQGRAQYRIGQTSSEASPGDLLHINRGVWQSFRVNGKQPVRVIVIHYTAQVFGGIPVSELLDFPVQIKLSPKDELREWIHQTCYIYGWQEPAWELELKAVVSRILLNLARRQKSSPSMDSQKLKHLRRILPALRQIRDTLDNPPSIESLAHDCSLSVAHFRRLFHLATSMSPIQYLRRFRIQRACQLLKNTDLTIKEIADRIGYGEVSYFYRTFHQLVGMGPGDYRRMEFL